jgi:hypothetical protein
VQFWSAEIEKQVGARVQMVLEDPALLEAYKTFGAEVLRRSSVFHGLDKFLREQKVSGDRCFEIGTWNALTSVVLSRYFREVVTVDIAHNALKHEVLALLGIKNVTCIDIRDNEEKARIAKSIHFDFAYLDGNHLEDTQTDFAITKKAQRVLFHEVWPFQAPVWELVHQLPPGDVAHNGQGLALWTYNKGGRK